MQPGKALVLLETSGNQAYVFSTNKLKQQIGASELTYRAGTRWLAEALGVAGRDADSPPDWRQLLREQRGQLAAGVEVIIATSGKALLRCDDQAQASEIIRKITERALDEAPGLQVSGALVELPTGDQKSGGGRCGDAAVARALQRPSANTHPAAAAPSAHAAH